MPACQAGLCIGVGNASIASGLQSTSRSWLDHVERETVSSRTWSGGPQTSLASGVWMHLGFAAVFVALGALLNASNSVFANRGYQHGRVVLISTYTVTRRRRWWRWRWWVVVGGGRWWWWWW